MELYFSGLSKTTKDKNIRQTFAGVTSVVLGFDGHYARVSFTSEEFMLEAMRRCGEIVFGRRPLIVSSSEQQSLYVLVRDLAPNIKNADVFKHFKSNVPTARDPIVYLPMDGNINKGYAFVYVASHEHVTECLDLDGSYMACKKITVHRGLFPDGRGIKRH